jgi:hypothetical protein
MVVRQISKVPDAQDAPTGYDDCLRKGEEIFARALKGTSTMIIPDQRQGFNTEASELRWFLLPSEAKALLSGIALPKIVTPFSPREYASNMQEYDSQHYSTVPARMNKSKLSVEEIKPIEERNGNINQKNETKEDYVDNVDNDSDCDGYESPEESESFLADVYNFHDDEDEETKILAKKSIARNASARLWMSPMKNIMKPTLEALLRYKMISNGDRVLVCVSGGKDSLTLLHTLRQYQKQSKGFGISFEIGAMTVDPGSSSYDPSPLIPYMEQLGIPYFYERQCIKYFSIKDIT